MTKLVQKRKVTESMMTKDRVKTESEAARDRTEHFPVQSQHSWAVKSTVARARNLSWPGFII